MTVSWKKECHKIIHLDIPMARLFPSFPVANASSCIIGQQPPTRRSVDALRDIEISGKSKERSASYKQIWGSGIHKRRVLRKIGSGDEDKRCSDEVGEESSHGGSHKKRVGNQTIQRVLESTECDAALFWAGIHQNCEYRRVRVV